MPSKEKLKSNSTLGLLNNCPYLFLEAKCLDKECGNVFYIGGLPTCKCYKKKKFNNTRVLVNGEKFDSLREARRYSKLSFLVSKDVIKELKTQPVFPMIINGTKIGKYIADFQFMYEGKKVVEDVKGRQTTAFKLKLKIVSALYPDVTVELIF